MEYNHKYDLYGKPVSFGQTLGMVGLTSEFPTYYTNSLEMDAYFIGYLRNNGYINVYGEGLADASEEDIQKWSNDFYKNYKKEHSEYKDAIEAKYGEHWVWHKDWWMEY